MSEKSTALVRLDPQALLTRAVENNASIETLERLVALAKDVREVQAKEAYHTAMAAFQQRCPVIDKSSKANIYTAKGSYTYRYAPLDKIMVAIRPLLAELGLSVTWTSREESNRVVAKCTGIGWHKRHLSRSMPHDQKCFPQATHSFSCFLLIGSIMSFLHKPCNLSRSRS